MLMNKLDVLVIGGGASGMMAAICAARAGASVLLLEQNKVLGKKLRITGGGRCNIYNAEPNMRLLLQNYGKAEQSLYSAYTEFGPSQSKEFFASIGIGTKTEARNRAFPVSEHAPDVANAMANALKRDGVKRQMGAKVTEVQTNNGDVSGVVVDGQVIHANNYVLATGGASKPETGSRGDGFGWLEQLGHTVNKPTPTITPLRVNDAWIKSLTGTTLQNVSIAFIQSDKRQFSLAGNILCTHFGISGPLILNNAYKVAELLNTDSVQAEIDCYPALDHKQLDTNIQSKLAAHPSKQVKNVLKAFVPTGMSQVIIDMLPNTNFDTKTSEFSKQDRKEIVQVLKAMPLEISGLMGFDKAVVADGGIDISEVDMRTMQSSKLNNLYITGDLLDIRRPSGGFSLQLCWTTGYLAGTHSAKRLST